MDDACTWYEDQRQGLGSEFLQAVDQVIAAVVEGPMQYRVLVLDSTKPACAGSPTGFSLGYCLTKSWSSDVFTQAETHDNGASVATDLPLCTNQ